MGAETIPGSKFTEALPNPHALNPDESLPQEVTVAQSTKACAQRQTLRDQCVGMAWIRQAHEEAARALAGGAGAPFNQLRFLQELFRSGQEQGRPRFVPTSPAMYARACAQVHQLQEASKQAVSNNSRICNDLSMLHELQAVDTALLQTGTVRSQSCASGKKV